MSGTFPDFIPRRKKGARMENPNVQLNEDEVFWVNESTARHPLFGTPEKVDLLLVRGDDGRLYPCWRLAGGEGYAISRDRNYLSVSQTEYEASFRRPKVGDFVDLWTWAEWGYAEPVKVEVLKVIDLSQLRVRLPAGWDREILVGRFEPNTEFLADGGLELDFDTDFLGW